MQKLADAIKKSPGFEAGKTKVYLYACYSGSAGHNQPSTAEQLAKLLPGNPVFGAPGEVGFPLWGLIPPLAQAHFDGDWIGFKVEIYGPPAPR